MTTGCPSPIWNYGTPIKSWNYEKTAVRYLPFMTSITSTFRQKTDLLYQYWFTKWCTHPLKVTNYFKIPFIAWTVLFFEDRNNYGWVEDCKSINDTTDETIYNTLLWTARVNEWTSVKKWNPTMSNTSVIPTLVPPFNPGKTLWTKQNSTGYSTCCVSHGQTTKIIQH